MAGKIRRTCAVDLSPRPPGLFFLFLLIAGGLIAVRSAGVAIGWGIQFQQPIFLVVMTLILTLFACNLLGLFEIILPGRLANIAGSAGDPNSLGGHFYDGCLCDPPGNTL